MIVVDASAIVAILLDEPEAVSFREFLLSNSEICLSPVGYWEAVTRIRGARGNAGVDELRVVLDMLRIQIGPATGYTAQIAQEAEQAFGKQTRAKLNLGDCFAYALAKELGAPILFKGNDFSQTDLVSALPA